MSNDDRNEIISYTNTIFSMEYPILDVGKTMGSTGYIDYISLDDLGSNNVMVGMDCTSRKFIVFKAQVEFSNGVKKQTLTTFFQRYDDNKVLYHCCGHHGIYLLCTDGGASVRQIKFLCELLTRGKYVFDGDDLDYICINNQLTLKLTPTPESIYHVNSDIMCEKRDKSICPIKVTIGYDE